MTRKRIHFIGVGGVGMAGLAVLLKAHGYEVSGCDLSATPRTRWLEVLGIPVFVGHSPDHVKDVDEVVVTPAVPPDAPERVLAAKNADERKGRLRSRGEVLAELVNASDGIAVCGSHGKTTTSTWIAKLLLALGENVSWCIGGETGSFPVAHAANGEAASSPLQNGEAESLPLQKGEAVSSPLVRKELRGPLVVEADESDGTLALYRAKTLVVTNCEYDHPDHFKTPADYFACFETAKRNADTVIEGEKLAPLAELEGLDCLASLAPHNRKNACVAVEVALRRGHRLADIAHALPAVVAALPDRRFQRIWPLSPQSNNPNNRPIEQSAGLLVYTDYAHHPTEMRNAVGMARKICRGTLRVLYQPHRYSRTKALLRDFPAAFDGADEVVLCPTYAAFERPLEGGDIADLYRACRESPNTETQSRRGWFLARSCEEAWEHAFNSMRDGDLTLLLGAGDIINLVPMVQRELNAVSPCLSVKRTPVRRIWIGAGSNTWKSDLNLAVEYVKTTGPANAPGASLGIPWMAGIPGTVGGWIKMNAGAFGHSISEVLSEVKVDGRWLPAAACGFAYRHSDIVGEIQDFRLKNGEAASSPLQNGEAESLPLRKEEFDPSRSGKDPASPLTASDYLARRKRFPAGTYGSFFKNPPGDFAGRLLEESGAKGLRVGGAYVWREHANVIVRGEGATASDVLALARLMRNRVLFRFGVALEPEVCGITF